ncbi:MAG: hypothetical protein Aurels2KO_32150 [Aureliella sp.]
MLLISCHAVVSLGDLALNFVELPIRAVFYACAHLDKLMLIVCVVAPAGLNVDVAEVADRSPSTNTEA